MVPVSAPIILPILERAEVWGSGGGGDGQGDPESLTEGRGSEDSLGLPGVDIGVMAGMPLQRSPRGLSLLILQDPDKIGSRSVSDSGHLKKIFE